MEATFVSNLVDQLYKNLGDTLNSLGMSGIDWQVLLVHLAGQLIITSIYLAFFAGLYLLVMFIVQQVFGRIPLRSINIRHVRTSVRYLLLLGASLAIFAQFGASTEFLGALARAGFVALGFFIGWMILSRVVENLLSRYRVDPSIQQLIENLLSVCALALGVVTVLAQFGFDVVSIVAGLGIVGIAVGFAAQSTLSNFIAGITLLIERPFSIGDWVIINGQEGKVIRIALRTTWLRTRDNIFTMIPNDSVASTDIINYSAEGPTRLNIPLGIAYKESVATARDAIMKVLAAHPEVIQRDDMAPRVLLKNLADSSVNLMAQVWIEAGDLDHQPKIMADLLETIKEALDAEDIEIPFPHLQLFIDEAAGLTPVLEPLYTATAAPAEQKPG
ncbi:mechanosensitive ion channel family protein [Marinobacter sp. X15-166B]|uniref:mechanosensitive ion channel family protein n=1 Tax=Marinobacter sp. X15-166B TaxID=1897620 RepID=UPI00085BBE9C|nr:mechanosensitive ion channel family protein [Marinobacter sp. X15-166B]OEY67261.1 mechanosensitive ion channel protein MscS [Marinobacter sp. X15-166B]